MAMDFSGQKSRVIENPSEVLSVAVEEGLSWRVSQGSCSQTSSSSQSTFSNYYKYCEFKIDTGGS